MRHLVKQGWFEIAIEIQEFHRQQCRDDDHWTVDKTAVLLNRSIGSISQYLKIASWAKSHEKQIKRCSSLRDALAFIKMKEREQLLDG